MTNTSAPRARALALALALAAAAAAAAAACRDYLTETPRATIVADAYFKTANDARAAIAGAYRPLSTGSLWGTNLQWGLNAASDESRVGPEEENANIVALTQLRWTPTNPYVAGTSTGGGAWGGLYQMVTRANLVTERVPGIAMDETAKAQIVGEAKFLRALGYFYLVRLYGDVPLVTSSEQQAASAAAGRTPQADVFAQIIKDATEAEAALPVSWPAADRGRAPKAAAQALLADVHLWRKDWANAAASARRVVDAGTYALRPNYLDAFLPGSQNRSEEIFAAQATSTTGGVAVDIAVWTYPRFLDPNSAGGWGTYQPLPWFIESYAPGDYRRDVSFFTRGRTSAGRDTSFLPHIYKFRPSQRPGLPQDVNFPIYRYADVLMILAEALNEQGQTAQAVALVNQVRARARNGAGGENRAQPADLPASLGAAEAREAIFRERTWEFAFEGKRWFDLVRRGPEYFTASLRRDPTAIDVQPTDMLWPIPQVQIDLNPQLVQNPGY
jgi:hypothetical protein